MCGGTNSLGEDIGILRNLEQSEKPKEPYANAIVERSNNEAIRMLFSCLCGGTVNLGRPITHIENGRIILDAVEAHCPNCKMHWKVSVKFEEI